MSTPILHVAATSNASGKAGLEPIPDRRSRRLSIGSPVFVGRMFWLH